MDLLKPIYTEKTECQDCYKCIRECPVKAISVENGHAAIMSELCVLCGHCVTICPAHAKRVRDDLSRAKQLLPLKQRVILSIAPSFASEFSEYTINQLICAIKKLGFFGISETAIGADLVSAKIAKDLEEAKENCKNNPNSQKIFISSACPSAVEYVKKYLPRYSAFITDRASPLLAHSRYLRDFFGDDIGIIFAGPCIAKKREADTWQEIDLTISFQDLRAWFKQAGINPLDFPKTKEESDNTSEIETAPDSFFTNENGFIPNEAAKGALYPIEGGMIASIKKYTTLKDIQTIAITGVKDFETALSGLKNDELQEPVFLELLSCSGGCISGPLASKTEPTTAKRIRVINYCNHKKQTLDLPSLSLSGTIPVEMVKEPHHTEEEIMHALWSVGKFTPKDEINCGSCGYDTCRAFADAILEKRAEKTMCVSYMKKLAQKKANGLIKAIPSGAVIADKDMLIVECNQTFARLMGPEIADMFEAKPGLEGADLRKIVPFSRYFEDVLAFDGPDIVDRDIRDGNNIFHISIFTIEKGEAVGGVIQDVTAPQMRKDRVISQAQKVISKNLSTVQQIAFLLGENAADTESMLNSIIESFGGSDV